MTRRLVVKVTCGSEDAERCNQAFTVAAAAVAAGADVGLWLTGEAAWFALPGRAEAFALDLAAPLADLLAAVVMPPLVYVVLVLVGGVVERTGSGGSFVVQQAIELVNALVLGAPVLLAATGLAAAVALVRWKRGPSSR